jgi:hypothetical protein
MKKRTTMTRKQLGAILTQHAIDQSFRPEMYMLVMHGVRPGDELLRRLHNDRQARSLRQLV